jgi:hypothetical protein
MIKNRNTVAAGGVGGIALIAFLILNSINIHAVMAQSPDGQAYNDQILSSNTSNDYNSWVRWSVTTDQPFGVSLASGFNQYTYQMNTVLNNDQYGCGSCGTWWLQGVVYTQIANGAATVLDAEEWVDSSTSGLCSGTTSTYCPFCPLGAVGYNVNYTGYNVLQETTLVNSSSLTYLANVENNSGGSLWTNSATCSYPTGYGPVNFFTRAEGVVVGEGNQTWASFSPLSSTIFSPTYLDLVSNYNDMSYQNTTTQTGESSNLYQNTGQAYGESYGSMYLYTVISSEITKTDSCPCAPG